MKKIVSIILVVSMLLGMVAMHAGAEDTVTVDGVEYKSDYPYIFVHGMGGWGPDSDFYATSPY